MKHKSFVSEVIGKVNKLPPALLSFEHGDVNPNEVGTMRCAVLREEAGAGQRVVVVATPHLQYMSKGPTDTGSTTTYIALRNKNTNKVRLFETECHTLSPIIVKEREEAKDADVSSVTDKYAQLSKSFGSKMAKRRQEQMERTVIHASNLEDQLAEVTQNMKVAAEDLNFSDKGMNTLKDLLPPFNPEAKSASQVYELTNILSAEELESLDIVCDEVFADPNSYNKHFLPRVLASRDRTRLKVLLYADCLIKFVGTAIKNLSRKDLELCPFSKQICDNILNNFTSKMGSKRNRSTTQKDKALCYIIVLGLLACGLQLDLSLLVNSLVRVGLKKLQELRRIVGAVASDKPDVIVLKVPLPLLRETRKGSKPANKRK